MSRTLHTSFVTSIMLIGSLTMVGCSKTESNSASNQDGATENSTQQVSNTPAPTSNPIIKPETGTSQLLANPIPASSVPLANRGEIKGAPMDMKTNAFSSSRSAAAYLKASPEAVNLGEMATSETKSMILTLSNTSDQAITIEKAKTSCGCTTAGIDPGTVINPGESVEVSVSLRGGARAQLISKTVSFLVAGMDPLVVSVRGQTVEYVQVSPQTLDQTTNPSGSITLRSIDNQPFRITGISPPLMAKTDFDQELKTVQVISFPWDKYEEYGLTRRITFHLEHPRVQSVFVNVRVDANVLNNPSNNVAPGVGAGALNPQAPPRAGMALVTELFKQGNTAEVIRQLESGMSIESKDRTGMTMLSLACRYTDGEFVMQMIERGADIEGADNAGRSPLMTAAQYGNLDAIQALIDSGARVNARDRIGNTAVSWAAGFGTSECVTELIQAGAEIEAVSNVTGWTPLIWAAGFGDAESVRVLVEAGANLEVGDIMQGATPLINASRTGKTESLTILVAAGANLETKDRNGKTALLAACENAGGTMEKVQILLNAGADISATDNRGKNAYQLARARTDPRAQAVINLLAPLFNNDAN